MSNKQKLPKHITAHEDLDSSVPGLTVALCNKENGQFWFAYPSDSESLLNAVRKLNSGTALDIGSSLYKYVGKQIVF